MINHIYKCDIKIRKFPLVQYYMLLANLKATNLYSKVIFLEEINNEKKFFK